MVYRADDSSAQLERGRPRNLVSPAVTEQAARGDREAQQLLLQAYIGSIRRVVARLVGNPADVDDLVQTACAEVLRSLPRFKGQASLGLWIDRITTRVVYKHYRSSRRRRARLTLVAAPESRAQQADEARRIEFREGLRRARQVVDSVKPERRIVFLLVAVEGRSLQEAATILDLSLSATKARFLRARRDIDRKLASQPALVELLRNAAVVSE